MDDRSSSASRSSPTDSVQSKDDPQHSDPQEKKTSADEADPVAHEEKDGEEKKDKLKEMGFFTLKVNLVLPGVAQPLEVTVSDFVKGKGS